MEKIEDIEMFIRDEEEHGVFAFSLVKTPAMEKENFVALSENNVNLKIADKKRRIVVGYALAPEKRILRRMKGKEFNIYFSKDTVAKSAELFMRNLNLNNATTNHEKPVQGCTIIESWITEDVKNDKINLYGIEPVEGAWAVMMKVYNDEEWERVENGDYEGLSLEGHYGGFEKIGLTGEEPKKITDEDILNALCKIAEDEEK